MGKAKQFCGVSAGEDFCQWLSSGSLSNYIAVFLNLMSYDPAFIMQYLQQNHTYPEVIVKSPKFLQIHVRQCLQNEYKTFSQHFCFADTPSKYYSTRQFGLLAYGPSRYAESIRFCQQKLKLFVFRFVSPKVDVRMLQGYTEETKLHYLEGMFIRFHMVLRFRYTEIHKHLSANSGNLSTKTTHGHS